MFVSQIVYVEYAGSRWPSSIFVHGVQDIIHQTWKAHHRVFAGRLSGYQMQVVRRLSIIESSWWAPVSAALDWLLPKIIENNELSLFRTHEATVGLEGFYHHLKFLGLLPSFRSVCAVSKNSCLEIVSYRSKRWYFSKGRKMRCAAFKYLPREFTSRGNAIVPQLNQEIRQFLSTKTTITQSKFRHNLGTR